MASARPYPPSEQRLAEARESGHAPRLALVAICTSVIVLALMGVLALPRLWRALISFVRVAWIAVGSGRAPFAHAAFSRLQGELLGFLTGGLLGVVGAVALACVLGRGAHFGFVPTRGASRFARLARGREAPFLWVLGLVACAGFALEDVAILEPGELTTRALIWLETVALLSLACALLDVAFARARFFASLWMTRRELLDEQRVAHGAPELRALRARLLREQREQTRTLAAEHDAPGLRHLRARVRRLDGVGTASREDEDASHSGSAS